MAAKEAVKTMLRCVFVGSIPICDTEIERRPYHRNCGCALHDLKRVCSMADSRQKNNISISLPKKDSWNHCSVTSMASKFSSQQAYSPLCYRNTNGDHRLKDSSHR